MRNIFWILYGVIAILFFGICSYGFLSLGQLQLIEVSRESAMIEYITPILFMAASILFFVHYAMRKFFMDCAGGVIMMIAGAREMDLHKEFTQDSILKSRFYLDPLIPVNEKIIGGIVVLVLVCCAIYLLSKYKKFLRSLFSGAVSTWGVFIGLSCLTFAKMLDSMGRLFPFLADFKDRNVGGLMYVEELLELSGAAFFVIVALVLLVQGRANVTSD